jgi:hypothetical protein
VVEGAERRGGGGCVSDGGSGDGVTTTMAR